MSGEKKRVQNLDDSREAITPSAKRPRLSAAAQSPISDDDDLAYQTVAIGSPTTDESRLLTPCGRPSVTANPIRAKFTTKYRGVKNSETVSGMHLSLGKAIGVVDISMMGYKFSVQEQRNHHVRLQIFENAAHFCLDPGDWEMIMSSGLAAVQQFILNMCTRKQRACLLTCLRSSANIFKTMSLALFRGTLIFKSIWGWI